MEYVPLSDAGELEIEYVGTPLDLYSFGMFHLNIQEIIDKVAFGLLSQQGILDPTWRRPRYLPARFPPPYRRIVKADMSKVQVGSLLESLTFGIAVVLADPNVRAVLQNLTANLIWAMSVSGIRGIVDKSPDFMSGHFPWRQRRDPFEVGPNLRDIILAVAENNGGKDSQITFKSRYRNQQTVEMTIRITGRENRDHC